MFIRNDTEPPGFTNPFSTAGTRNSTQLKVLTCFIEPKVAIYCIKKVELYGELVILDVIDSELAERRRYQRRNIPHGSVSSYVSGAVHVLPIRSSPQLILPEHDDTILATGRRLRLY
jgi:hypothetical protein